jgi:hypothetical protein
MRAVLELLAELVKTPLRKLFDKRRNSTIDLKELVEQRKKLGIGYRLSVAQRFLIWVFTW